MNELSYCGALVRDYDRDRFLISLFAPADRQEALWALFAFNHEIAKTREVVSDATLGRIRLQWWMDAIRNFYESGVVPEHEILKPLCAAIQKYQLPMEDFATLIAARNFDLDARTFDNIDECLSYAEASSVPLWALAVRMEGFDPAYEPVQAVGLNYAIAGILRAAPYQKVQGWDVLPVAPSEIGAHFVRKARSQSRVLRAAQGMARLYMQRIRALGYELENPKMAVPVAFKELRVTLAVVKG